jgi:hypothetical protein
LSEARNFRALFANCFRQSGWLLGDFLQHQGQGNSPGLEGGRVRRSAGISADSKQHHDLVIVFALNIR